jgi:hypothetical protein
MHSLLVDSASQAPSEVSFVPSTVRRGDMTTPAELRRQSRSLLDAAERETDCAIKRERLNRALIIAQLAEQIERTGAFVAPENIERYRLLFARDGLDEQLRSALEKLLAYGRTGRSVRPACEFRRGG